MKPLFLLILIFEFFCSHAAAADSPPSYHLTLVTIKDTGEVVALIGSVGFTTVESLKTYIGDVLPKAATIYWRAAHYPPAGWKKFTAAWGDLKKFCEERSGKFVVLPAPL